MPARQAGPAADTLLQCQIASQLAETNRPNLRRLAVRVADGSVTLHGRVTSFYEKQLAIGTCRMLAGMERLIDAVEVAAATT